jgi:hypothetical protein
MHHLAVREEDVETFGLLEENTPLASVDSEHGPIRRVMREQDAALRYHEVAVARA